MDLPQAMDGGALEVAKAYAEEIVRSKLFPSVKDEAQAFVLLELARASGKPMIQAMTTYDVIQGRPRMRGDALLAGYLAAGHKLEVHHRTAESCSVTATHKTGNPSVSVEFTMREATQIGLTKRNPNYRLYPRRMLYWRATGEAIQAVAPGIGQGFLMPGEEPTGPRTKRVEARVEPQGPAVPKWREPLTDAQREEIRVNEAIEKDLEREIHAPETPKRRGRKPGSKNKPKEETPPPALQAMAEPTPTKPEPDPEEGAVSSEPEPVPESLVNQLSRKLKAMGVPPADMRQKVEQALGREVKGFADISEDEAGQVLQDLAASEPSDV